MVHFPTVESSELMVVPLFSHIRLHVIPSVLGLLPQIGLSLIKKGQLKVIETANRNTKEVLEQHLEGHRRNAKIQEKLQQAFTRTHTK